MHWLLEVHDSEDYCRIANSTIQENLNQLRKSALGLMKQFKQRSGSKLALSKTMFNCLLDDRLLCNSLEN